MSITHKKSGRIHIRRLTPEAISDRCCYLRAALSFHPSRLFFLDESGFGVADCSRSYGWGKGRIHIVHRFQRRPQHNVIAVVGYDGVVVTSLVPTTNSNTFLLTVLNDVLPRLPPHTMLIMDNHPVHRTLQVRQEIEATFARHNIGLGFLPVYSPDLNPIEYLFGQVKAFIKEEGEFEIDPIGAITRAFARITSDQCKSWYLHCGYE
jgi:transposase